MCTGGKGGCCCWHIRLLLTVWHLYLLSMLYDRGFAQSLARLDGLLQVRVLKYVAATCSYGSAPLR